MVGRLAPVQAPPLFLLCTSLSQDLTPSDSALCTWDRQAGLNLLRQDFVVYPRSTLNSWQSSCLLNAGITGLLQHAMPGLLQACLDSS